MKSQKEIIIGSGLSSFVYFKNNIKKKIKILTNSDARVIKSKNFYEYDSIGGNSNIWGGYLNYKRHKQFLKNQNYKRFFKGKILFINKIFSDKSKYSNTYCVSNSKNKIFRIKKSFFNNQLISKRVESINIRKKNLKIIFDNGNSIKANKIVLCVGNLNLIKLMFASGWINSSDTISYDDGQCSYVLDLFNNNKSDYYIPMPINQILKKLIFNKSLSYKLIDKTFILQKFSNITKNHKISCEEVLKMKANKIRYFLSNHIANLRINNIPVRNFIKYKSKKIDIFCSGALKKYFPGPVIQDLIFDIVNRKK